MRVRGPVAIDAHLFANEQWRYTCSTMTFTYCFITGSVCAHGFTAGSINNICPPQVDKNQLTSEQAGDTRVLGMGRLAYIDAGNMSNSSDTGFIAMLSSAKSSIKIAQQDIGPPRCRCLAFPPEAGPSRCFASLARRWCAASMSTSWSVTRTRWRVAWIVNTAVTATAGRRKKSRPSCATASSPTRRPGRPAGQALRDLLCQKLHLAPLRFSSEETFPDGTPLPNHAKFVMIDDQAFYLGSQNQYDAGLTEFGFLVDDARAAFNVVQTYYTAVAAVEPSCRIRQRSRDLRHPLAAAASSCRW